MESVSLDGIHIAILANELAFRKTNAPAVRDVASVMAIHQPGDQPEVTTVFENASKKGHNPRKQPNW